MNLWKEIWRRWLPNELDMLLQSTLMKKLLLKKLILLGTANLFLTLSQSPLLGPPKNIRKP